ncbi:MAG: hypothetical protein WAW37_05870 [Syntrophobacteraceae bacterium]
MSEKKLRCENIVVEDARHARWIIANVHADPKHPYFHADDPRHQMAVEEMAKLHEWANEDQPQPLFDPSGEIANSTVGRVAEELAAKR